MNRYVNDEHSVSTKPYTCGFEGERSNLIVNLYVKCTIYDYFKQILVDVVSY